MTKPRDFQRSKVYNAERAHSLWEEVKEWETYFTGENYRSRPKQNEKWMTYQESCDYVNSITSTQFWKNHEGKSSIKVKDGRGTSWAHGSSNGWISLPRWARHPLVILHELTHTVIPVSRYPGHGIEFCRLYLALIERFLGKEAKKEMEGLFKHYKVRYTFRGQQLQMEI